MYGIYKECISFFFKSQMKFHIYYSKKFRITYYIIFFFTYDFKLKQLFLAEIV